MGTKAGWSVLIAMVAVALMAELTTGLDLPRGMARTAAIVGSAVVGFMAPRCVDRVRARAAARELADRVGQKPRPSNPAGLLRADQCVVPFTGRAQEYQELREWCRDDKPPVRLMVGAGGVGKTRLALELGDYLTSCGWSVTVVAPGREANALTILRAASTRSSIFLVVDYAETRAGLVDLLRSVVDHPEHVRVLLIARSAGDWWDQLVADAPAVRDLVQAYDPMKLSAHVDPTRSPAELVREAVPHFAKERGVPAPKIHISVPAEVPLLTLHAAALLAVLRSQDQRTPAEQLVADLGVLTELLGHESRFWVQSAEEAKLGLGPVVLRRAVAVACLFGAVSESDGAEILRRVPDLRDSENQRRKVARWLAELYPSGPGYWGPLQPELLAETHVITQLEKCPELIMVDLPEPHDEQARQMLTLLSRGAAHQPAGQELLGQALRADLERLVFPALEVAKATGGALGTVLVRVLSTALVTPAMLDQIERAIPYPTTALAETAVVVTRHIVDALPPDADIAEYARWNLKLGVVLAQAGHADEALPHIDTAVGHYRDLVETDRDRYLPDLARSLHNLGSRYMDQGRHDDALPPTAQAIKYYRELAEHGPGRYQANLAAALSNLGLTLVELDRHSAALEPLNDAVEHYQELVETDDRYRPDLAKALSYQRLSQSKVPSRGESVPLLEKVVNHNRTQVETDRDRYLPDLAQSLLDLSNGYAEQDRRTEAVHHVEEALTYYRTLTEGLERYRPALAACLNNLGANLTELGHYPEALPYAEEAVEVNRRLTMINIARYRPELARSLDNLVACLSKMGQHLDVLPHATEAVELYRRLTETDPDRYRPELARSLDNLSFSLTERRRHSEALPDSREAVIIYRDLVEIDRHKYSPLLAQALRNLAVDYSGLSRHAEADRCRQEFDELSSREGAS
ncbi:MAG: tetratricopeptide repeat protein [Pseudonocardiaceae bacterium]